MFGRFLAIESSMLSSLCPPIWCDCGLSLCSIKIMPLPKPYAAYKLERAYRRVKQKTASFIRLDLIHEQDSAYAYVRRDVKKDSVVIAVILFALKVL